MRPVPGALQRQPNVLARAAALAGSALLAAAVLAWSGPAPASGWSQSAAESTLWQLLNGARANNGLNVLIQHETLVSIARWRSQDMIERNYFSHTILGTSYLVYHWYDLNGLAYSGAAENIGWNSGYSDADSPVTVHNGFMNSPGHRANILGAGWTHGGVGAWGADGVPFLGGLSNPRVYAQLFMTAAGSTPPPPPPAGGGGSAAQPASTPTAPPRVVPDPVRPTSDEPIDGSGRLVHAGALDLPSRAWAGVDTREAPPPVVQMASLRVESAGPADRGVFETMLGALLGFLFG